MKTPAVDTIAAIATAAGSGGVGIVRLSGPASLDIARRISGRRPRPRHAHYVRFRDGAGETLDQGVLLYFPAPASFTGEDVVELQGHGGQVVLQRLLARTVELGARRARAGEFSERAFLNGKLDLAQAEAIADLIGAHSEQAARAAMRSLQGEFSQRVHALVERVTVLRVHVEAAIDFPDEDIDFLADRLIQQRLDAARDALAELQVQAQRGVKIRDGLHAVIVGPPNAGKSSLLNALAGSERAIVTERAGTTRDVLRETIRIDDFELVLADTAGLRSDSDDPIEREGMRRAREEQSRADLLLAVVECGDGAGEQALRAEFGGHPGLVWLHSKCDLHGETPRRETRDDHDHIWISTRDADGVAPLRGWLGARAGGIDPGHAGFSARQRHVEALQLADAHLESAALQLQRRCGELMAEELRLVQHALGEITGLLDADALLGRIFSSFCIGK